MLKLFSTVLVFYRYKIWKQNNTISCIFIQTLIIPRLMDNNDKVLILPVENVLTLKFMDEGRGKSVRQKTTNIGGGG